MPRTIRHISLTVGLAVLASVLLLLSRGEVTHAGAAIVLTPGFACGVLDGAGNAVPVADAGLVNVETDGNSSTIVCGASGIENDTGRAQRFNHGNTGLLCYVIGVGSTDDWHAVVSASGRSMLVCHIES